MNIQSQLDQFRNDNPYDNATQSKRLLATKDEKLILYVLALGLATARSRQRHAERDFIKNVGEAPPAEGLSSSLPGSVRVLSTRRTRNAMQQLICDIWRINGEQMLGDATGNDLAVVIKRERASSDGHQKNIKFYENLRTRLADPRDKVRDKWKEPELRGAIEKVYGEFRKQEAA